ncbi:hypothetical protein Bca52824_006301 [Brassica carinata]|uniref:RING-type E3 ubiquitin transferase n=1 Tax=Brassica carinata TaxID=52824 RepID=A0A8X7WSV6_BRACI|nr:hypothetical protein Bca52824_006301 [Brassica carinata]
MTALAAAVCLGLGFLMRISSSSNKNKTTCELLRRAIPVNDLKGLGDCLENKQIKSATVLVSGTVGSTSTVENSCLGVFIMETVELDTKLDIEKINAFGKVVPGSKTISASRKEVPWYLDDGTARVYVCDYRLATGFYDTLKKYFSTEPVITFFKTLGHDGKEKLMRNDVDSKKKQQVLEIGTYLTVVGRAVRDRDGAPTIAEAYRFFNGNIELEEFVTNLELGSE